MKTTDMKLKQLMIVTLACLPAGFSALAADGTDTNSPGSSQVAPAPSVEAVEIEALKKEVQELSQKVQNLERQRELEQPAAPDTNQEQIQALDQQVRILERQRELDQENAAALAKTQPRLSLGANGFSLSSADTNFVVALHGVLQADSRTFQKNDNVPGNSSILLRRARPILSGTVFRDFDFLFIPDFGNGTPGAASAATTPSIYDAYVNYRYSPALQIQAGKFKTPIGLEQLQADVNTTFNERSLVTDLVPNRDLGFELHGDIAGGVVSYAAGIFNGVGDARNSSNIGFEDNREFDGRLFVLPFKRTELTALQNLGVGISGGWGEGSITNTLGLPASTGGASSSAGYFTDGQQQFFAYTNGVLADRVHWRLSPQAYYYYGPLSLMGEYVLSDQDVRNGSRSASLRNTAWEVTGGWVLTGEDATFNGVTPKHPFDPRTGQWGAVQVVGRYADLDIDNAAFPFFANPAVSASEAKAWSVGLNWYLNRNILVKASFSRTSFEGGGTSAASAPGSVTSHPEEVFFTRVQLGF
ncbi:MAG TPA: porin [Verrucomicrobiae bacterium]|nr:porin [Verrucomicrobiae bacterium]